MISTLTAVIAVAMVSWYIFRRKQRQVTLTVRRTQRIKRLDALHIDIEYSDTNHDSPTTPERLSTGYTNLCSDISLDQDLPSRNPVNSPCDHTQASPTDEEVCISSNQTKESDGIISHSFSESFDDSLAATERCGEEQSNDEIKLVPPVRFDFETSSTNSFEIEMTLAAMKNEEMVEEHLRVKDDEGPENTSHEDRTADFPVPEKASDNSNETEGADNDRESLIERQNVTSYDNQGLDVTG